MTADRRNFLRVVCAATVCLSGCGSDSNTSTESAGVNSDRDSSETQASITDPDAETRDSGIAEKQPSSPIYFSEILPNPEGEDSENLPSEYCLIEVHTDDAIDLSGFEVSYGEKYSFTFSDDFTDVEPGTSIKIITGKRNEDTLTPHGRTRTVFLGRNSPVLSNSGMTLELRNRDGEVIDRVKYGDIREGFLYVRPE